MFVLDSTLHLLYSLSINPMNLNFSIILLFLVVVVLLIFKDWVDSHFHRPTLYRYLKRTCIMTETERKCFKAIDQAIGGAYYIFPQVHLPSFLDNKIVGQNWRGAFRHVDEKSVDFVLCDKDKLSPILAIELDDRSHARPDRQERDREVERILADARMPLLRLKDHAAFGDIEKLKRDINEKLGHGQMAAEVSL